MRQYDETKGFASFSTEETGASSARRTFHMASDRF